MPKPPAEDGGYEQGWVPRPDPTALTSTAVAAAKDDLRREMSAAVALLTEKISALSALHDGRFDAIAQQFSERDTRGEQEKKAAKEALDAALLAQKESVSQQNDANTTAATKSETSFTKQIDQVGTLITTLDKSWADRFAELKERIDRGEGGSAGAQAQRTESRLNTGQWVAIASALLLAVAIIVSVALAVFK
jgi:hypothetical protein